MQLALVVGLLLTAVPAQAAGRWEEVSGGAVAILPEPKPAAPIAGGSFYCIEQRWAFLFRLAPDSGLAAGAEKARLSVADQALELEAEISAGAAKVSVPGDLLQPLKDGASFKIEIGAGKSTPKATFNLRSSRRVIEAIAPRCSQVDMSAYQSVSLSATDAASPTATGLLAEEIKEFRAFTGADPVVSTAVLDVAGDRHLMFASLCGSTRYLGDSGCSLTGYATDGANDGWRMVYETEGMLLYTDPRQSNGGWPNIVTLPVIGGIEPMHWVWSGEQYQLQDQALIAGESTAKEQGDTAQ